MMMSILMMTHIIYDEELDNVYTDINKETLPVVKEVEEENNNSIN